MRLIDADELLNKTISLEAEAREQVVKNEPLDNPKKWHIWNGVLAERTAFKYDLLDAPTVDAEPVVRCKDCRFYLQSNEECDLVKTRLRFYEKDKRWTDDCFCSWGERKEDAEKID